MPETKEMEAHIRRVAQARRFAQDHATMLTTDLRAEMRGARSAGLSLKKLSEASGLSIAQVQRICDLSKEANRE